MPTTMATIPAVICTSSLISGSHATNAPAVVVIAPISPLWSFIYFVEWLELVSPALQKPNQSSASSSEWDCQIHQAHHPCTLRLVFHSFHPLKLESTRSSHCRHPSSYMVHSVDLAGNTQTGCTRLRLEKHPKPLETSPVRVRTRC